MSDTRLAAPLAADWLVGGGEMGALIRAKAWSGTPLGPIETRDAAESLRMLLEIVGAEASVAHNGLEALAKFEAHRPRLVLLDLGMPGIDGYEVARRLRARPAAHRVWIVALTGWGQDEDRRRVREAGFDHHLVKPADLGALQSLIASIEEDGNEAPAP